MADAGVFNADLGINMQFNIDGAGLVEMTKTIKEIAQGKDLEKYWTDVETATDKAVKAAQRYNKNLDSDRLAGSFLKQINALKALTGKEDVSDLFSGIGIDVNSLLQSAKDVVPKINSEFSPDKFSQAFKTFDMLKDKGIELGRVFEKLASYDSLSDKFFKVSDENNELKSLLGDMDINEVKKQLGEIQNLRQQAEESFDNFLTANNVDRKDWYGDERFVEYFDAIRSGTMTATDAITRFKTEYAYLLEESFKTSGNNFGLDQLQEFSKKLDSIFLRVEETSKKISDIILNGVIAKMTQDVPGESNLTNGQVLFNEDQLKSVLDLFGDIKDSLFSLRSVISDVGDGQEFSPLLQTIKEITGAVESLKQSVSKIGLNINIDAGEPDQKLLSNIEAKKQNLLSAYQSQFAAMKNFKIPGSIIAQGNIQNRDRVAALNKQILNFDGGASADNIDQRIAAYTKVIELMREASKLSYGRDVYADMDSSFKNALSSAKGQLTKAQNELANSNALGSGIENLFGSKDLDQVVVQLSRIADKFEEIANAANDFKTKFADGINVTTSIKEIQKLTQRVQELEAELSKIKAINPPTVQEPKKDAFQTDTTPVEKIVDNFKEAKQETEKATESAKDYIRTLSQVGEWNVDSKVSVVKQKNDGQLESWNYDAKRGKENITYDKYGNIDYGDPIITTISNYKQLEQTIVKADNELRDLQKTLKDVKETSPNASTENIEKQIQYQEKYISLLEQTIKIISQGDEYFLNEQQIIDARQKAETEYNLKQGTKSDISDAKRDAKSAKEEAKNIQAEWDKNVKAIQDYMDAATKLNNLQASDKGTGSKANEIEDQKNKVEEFKEKALEARTVLSSMVDPHWGSIDTWDSWIAAMEKLDQAAYGSSESIAKLKDSLKAVRDSQMKQLQNSIEKYDGILGNVSQYKTPNTNYQNQLTKFQTAINDLKTYKETLSGVTPLTEEQKAKIAELTAECDKCAKAFKNMSAAEKGSDERSRMKEADKITKYLQQNTRLSKEAKKQLESYVNLLRSSDADVDVGKIHTEWLKVTDAERAAGREGKSFFDVVKEKAWYGAASAIGTYFGIHDFIRYGRQVASIVTDINSKIIDLAKVSEATSSQIYKDFNSYAEIAKDIGGTISDTIEATTAWAKNGYSIPDAKELARVSQLYKNVGDNIDIASANESLISTLQGFQLEADQAEHIIDVFNEVSNNEAISSSGIGTALQRSAASFNAANTSLEKSVALVTATNTVLQDEEKVGNMWKTVSARLRGADTELKAMGEDTEGMAESTSKLRDLIKGMTGFDIMKDKDTFKDIYDIIVGIGEQWDKLSDTNRAALLEKLAGKNQSNALAAALSNIDILKKSYDEAMNSDGSAMREQEKYQESIQYSIDQTKAKLEELANDALSPDFLKGLIDGGGKLVDILDVLVSKLGLVKTAALGISAVLSLNNVGELKLY